MTNLLAFGNLGWGEILVILLVVLLLFGSAKIPQLMRGFGQGISEFKKGLKEGGADKDDDAEREKRPSANTSE